MVSTHQVRFVELRSNSECSTITHIGGIMPDGKLWKVDLQKAISCMNAGKCRFYVWDGFNRINLIIAICGSGHTTLKTEQDDSDTNILHSLPSFPEPVLAY